MRESLAKLSILGYPSRVNARHRIRFYQQMAMLARAGVPLRGSLERLQGRFSGNEVAILSRQISAGERLGDAFIAAGFTPFECHLVAAGERGGHLDTIFQHLSEFWTRQRELQDALIRPLYYPLAVLHFGLLVGALVEMTVISWPAAVFHLLTRLVLLYAVGFGLWFVVRTTWSSDLAQRFWLALPLIGRTLSAAHAWRWITALRIEFTAGITLSIAVADAWRASGYVGSEPLALESQQAIREGTELSKLLPRWKQLPRDWVDFIETGELSGGLQEAFTSLEEEAARTWRNAEQQMSEWLPKILYFIVLLIAAAQVASVMYQTIVTPITSAENAIDHAVNGN